MARKKKNTIVPEEPPIEDVVGGSEEPPIEDVVTGSEESQPEEVIEIEDTSPVVPEDLSAPSDSVVSLKDAVDISNAISHAHEVINRCNLYMWAGLDWGTGRIYEMARKEWAGYILAMEAWRDNGFVGPEPAKPSEITQ